MYVRVSRELARERTVYVYDPPGHGFSKGRRDYPRSMEDLTDHLAEWLVACGLNCAPLFGHSLGGEVIFDLAARYPNCTSALIACAPTGIPENPSVTMQVLRLLRDLPRERLPLLVPALSAYSTSGFGLMFRLASDQSQHDTGPLLPAVQVPTLLLDGDAAEGGLDLELGPIAGVRLNRTSDIKDRRVRRLGELDAAIEVGGFVGVGYKGLTNPYDRLGVRVELLQDVADAHGGYVVSPSIEFQTPLSTSLFVGASLSAEFASEDYADAYFSITPAGATASGLSAFDADGGYKNWGASLIAAHSLSGDLRRGFAVFGLANYKKLQNDFRRSPIVSQAGDADQWFGALGISYTF